MTDTKIKSSRKLLASGVPPRDLACNLGVSVPTLLSMVSGLHTALADFVIEVVANTFFEV
jgi:hypothetical protein